MHLICTVTLSNRYYCLDLMDEGADQREPLSSRPRITWLLERRAGFGPSPVTSEPTCLTLPPTCLLLLVEATIYVYGLRAGKQCFPLIQGPLHADTETQGDTLTQQLSENRS